MKYTELTCVTTNEEQCDILTAFLAQLDYESFMNESSTVLKAYIKTSLFDENSVKMLQEDLKDCFSFGYSFVNCPDENWNEKWEENYPPVLIDEKCYVRAPFHEALKNVDYDIVIQPKMSFGTAHHETTSQILSELLKVDCKGKSLLDMGCGTGVLAILAAKKGADMIWAVDNDEWAYENTLENVERNEATFIKAFLGDASLLKDVSFDIVIANINRNILLEDMDKYYNVLNPGGLLLLSGFYEDDFNMINERVTSLPEMQYVSSRTKNRWMVYEAHKNC
ncbi:MAG: 50S ribosomal protein L11 methyltransferase [Bacteroidales bacterium]|nr:50S ribosomal protein L11 methyltransferase [Bacteroidales bacterium]